MIPEPTPEQIAEIEKMFGKIPEPPQLLTDDDTVSAGR